METTRHREAALAAARGARQLNAQRDPGDPAQTIGRRMLLDISEATIVGFGELLDLGNNVGLSSAITVRAVAGAVASLTLSMANEDDSKALVVLPVVIAELQRVAEERLRADRANRSSAGVGDGIREERS